MPGLPDASANVTHGSLFDCSDAPFVVRCQCGRIWSVTLESSPSGQPRCVPCLCGVALVASNGATGLILSLVADPS